MVEILRQGQYEPLDVPKQITIFAGVKFLDGSSIDDVRTFVGFVNSDEAK